MRACVQASCMYGTRSNKKQQKYGAEGTAGRHAAAGGVSWRVGEHVEACAANNFNGNDYDEGTRYTRRGTRVIREGTQARHHPQGPHDHTDLHVSLPRQHKTPDVSTCQSRALLAGEQAG